MNVGVIGAGGVGGYFGGKLTQLLQTHSDLKIIFIARNEHLKVIRKSGLTLKTAADGELICRPTYVSDDFTELPELDLCLVCVKSYDLDSVLSSLKPKIMQSTHVIPLLNGADIYDRVRAVLPTGIVYPACAYLGTHIEESGKVAQNGGSCRIFFGRDPQNPGLVPQQIFDIFDAAHIKYTWLEEPLQEIWSKYVFIAAYGLVSASENKTLGEILENPALSKLVLGIMEEIAEIAAKEGISLPETIVTDSYEKARAFPYETKTSFQRDFEMIDRKDERVLYGDTIIKFGAWLGVNTPNTELANSKLSKIKMIQ
ncbi:MAG: ketopantoate reductase family protein [Thermoleophilia bacterium]